MPPLHNWLFAICVGVGAGSASYLLFTALAYAMDLLTALIHHLNRSPGRTR